MPQVSSHLSVTVYVEDINDHAPQFVDAPYHVTVDELTPVGEILANSDIINRAPHLNFS